MGALPDIVKANLEILVRVSFQLLFVALCEAQPSCPPGPGSAATNLGGMDCTARCDLCMTITPNNIEIHNGDTVSFRFTSRLATHGDAVIQGGGAVDWGEGDPPEPVSVGTVTVRHIFNKCPGTCVYTVWGSMAQDYKYDGAGSCSYKCLARQSAAVRVTPAAAIQPPPIQRDPDQDKKSTKGQENASDGNNTGLGTLLRSQPLDKLLAFGFGVVFVVVILIVAVFDRSPPAFTLFIYRVVLCLAAAGVGAVIPGIISVTINPFVRAGGAFALFVVVYWFNPPKLGAAQTATDEPSGSTIKYVAPESITLQQREDARKAFEATHARFRIGVDRISQVIGDHVTFVEVEAATCLKHQERLATYKAALEMARQLELEVKKNIELGVETPDDLPQVRLHRTNMELALAREQSA